MRRRDLVRKMAIPAAIILFVSIIGLILAAPIRNTLYKRHIQKLNAHIEELTENYQDYLTDTAQQINTIPVDPEIISTIQSKVLKEHPTIKLYLWMSDARGDFLFGAPSAVFTRLNQGFDRYYETIKNEGYYMDRNDFLIKLVDLHDHIDFTEFESPTMDKDKTYWYRVYREERRLRREWTRDRYYIYYTRPRCFVLSAPVTNEAGRGIGDLYLKIDDSYNNEMYLTKNRIEERDFYNILFPLFRVLAILSGIFLWFLLPTWVYMDAQQRDVKSPSIWAFLTLISAIFGLTIYLITRPQATKSFNCPKCDNELNGTKAFCPYCGFDLSSTFCPQCQYPIKPDWLFCPNCRADLKEEPQAEVPDEEEKKDSLNPA
jgi:hypothetical protein